MAENKVSENTVMKWLLETKVQTFGPEPWLFPPRVLLSLALALPSDTENLRCPGLTSQGNGRRRDASRSRPGHSHTVLAGSGLTAEKEVGEMRPRFLSVLSLVPGDAP